MIIVIVYENNYKSPTLKCSMKEERSSNINSDNMLSPPPPLKIKNWWSLWPYESASPVYNLDKITISYYQYVYMLYYCQFVAYSMSFVIIYQNFLWLPSCVFFWLKLNLSTQTDWKTDYTVKLLTTNCQGQTILLCYKHNSL